MALLTSPPAVNICGRRWAEEPEQWTFYRRFFSLLPSSRASLKMLRWHRLAHKAPVMQACVECTGTARQKHDLALCATRRHNRWRHCDCQPVTSSTVASSCITVSKQHHYQWVQRPKRSFMICEKCLYWLFILGDEMFTAGKSRPILLMQILYNAVKTDILQMWWIELKYGFYLQNPAYFPRVYL